MWMFENWAADQVENADLAKNHAYLIASFDHPEAVKQLLGEGNVHESTEEEFEESSRMVKEASAQTPPPNQGRKRKRRHLVTG